MKKAIKIFTDSNETVGASRLPLDSLIMLDDGSSDNYIGTIIDKAGITPTTTIKSIADDKTKYYPLSRLYDLNYDSHTSSLSVTIRS